MRNFIVAAALVAAGFAFADSEFRQGADYVRITAEPCKDEKVVALIAAAGEDATDFRAARADVGGKEFAGCWKPDFQKRVIFLHYEDGDLGMVPFQVLKPVREV